MKLENLLYQNIQDKQIQNQKNLEHNKQLKLKNTLGQEDFLKIFVAQLKAQNPLEPVKDKEFIAQMAQFSNLEQVTALNKKMDFFMQKTSANEYYALLGKQVKCYDPIDNRFHEGKVDSLEKEGEHFYLKMNQRLFKADSVVKVYEDESKMDVK